MAMTNEGQASNEGRVIIRKSNSNGEDVSPTVDCCIRKGCSSQLDRGGGVCPLPVPAIASKHVNPSTLNCMQTPKDRLLTPFAQEDVVIGSCMAESAISVNPKQVTLNGHIDHQVAVTLLQTMWKEPNVCVVFHGR